MVIAIIVRNMNRCNDPSWGNEGLARMSKCGLRRCFVVPVWVKGQDSPQIRNVTDRFPNRNVCLFSISWRSPKAHHSQ